MGAMWMCEPQEKLAWTLKTSEHVLNQYECKYICIYMYKDDRDNETYFS